MNPFEDNDNKQSENSNTQKSEQNEKFFQSFFAEMNEIFGFKLFKSKKSKESFNKNINPLNLVAGILILITLLWLATGFFIVAPEEQAIVLRLGRYHRTANSGLNYKLPEPIEQVFKAQVTRVKTIKIGVDDGFKQSVGSQYMRQKRQVLMHTTAPDVKSSERLEESLMLTGEENIVDVEFQIQWVINDLQKYFFNVKDQEMSVYDTGRSVIREVIGTTKLETILTSGRGAIEKQTQETLQAILDMYNSGVKIVLVQMLKADPPARVIDSFRDVQTARVDKESKINEAQAYANSIIPVARGEARKMIADAEGYALQVVNEAYGNASKFTSILEEYSRAKFVTRQRLYIDAMSVLFKNAKINVVDGGTVIFNSDNSKVVPIRE